MSTAPQTTFLKFPRGIAELEITVRADYIGIALWGPPAGQVHPLIIHASASASECWRMTTAADGMDPLPEKLFVDGASVGLTRSEADAFDVALRHTAPCTLREREAA